MHCERVRACAAAAEDGAPQLSPRWQGPGEWQRPELAAPGRASGLSGQRALLGLEPRAAAAAIGASGRAPRQAQQVKDRRRELLRA